MSEPYVSGDAHHLACGICPSRRFPLGAFDVLERPSEDCPFSAADGHRYLNDGTPVCVHPERVGLPAARYKSESAPLRIAVVLPDDTSEVVPYLNRLLYGAAPALLENLIAEAGTEIRRKFPGLDPVTVLRRALG
ncbi:MULTISPECIES: hypothetical protein [unclassified Streptomyces]|uniref:hypothetical protein n=1 Tax=unclassified Streptomyces TaxID=2593676 RepID=UPI000DDBD176|nr:MULTISPECIES: hypothetical protein [unclassified Streptomyces]QZZ30301.1 hypothetical protein A7X85_32305 [Streptomyces sp. ST1015]